jgi:hypothetical protein
MSLECSQTLPRLVKVPQFDGHIIAGRKHVGLSGVYSYTPYFLPISLLVRDVSNKHTVVGMRLEVRDFFRRVIVQHAQLEVLPCVNLESARAVFQADIHPIQRLASSFVQ